MAGIEANIHNFAPKNEELLGILRQTDYAEAALAQQVVYVKDLESELRQLTKKIRTLEGKTRVEKFEFEKLRDSTMKRFAYKLGGSKGKDKFQSKTEKEEREYYEALEEERAAKDRKESLDAALREGIATRDNYQREDSTHKQAQQDLDSLYNMVFAGPTPSYPHEDQGEWSFTQARERYNVVEGKYRANWQACDLFNDARKKMDIAARQMGEARSASQMDMFGGGTFADMAERSALSKAESESSQARSLVSQARRIFPEGVQEMQHIEIDTGHMVSDMLFDNIFTDMAMHDRIKASQIKVNEAQKNVESQFASLNERLKGNKAELDIAQAELTDARKKLQDMRSQIFTQVSGQQPPPYQA